MQRRNGFTLIELLIVLAILGIFVAIAIPNFRSMSERNAVSSQTNAIIGFLQLARSEAVTRRQATTICPANAAQDSCSGTNIAINGALITQNGQVIKVLPKASSASISSTGSTSLIFNADGTSNGGGWTVSYSNGSTSAKNITVNAAGRTTHQ